MKSPYITTRSLGLGLFTLFLLWLVWQAVLPPLSIDSDGLHLAPTSRVSTFNFIPFAIFADSYRQALRHHNLVYFFLNFCGNIGVFLPLGFFPPLLWRVSRKKVLLIGLFCSLFIEICQIPQARDTDIDDIWLNSAGALLGYAVYRLLEGKYPYFISRFKSMV